VRPAVNLIFLIAVQQVLNGTISEKGILAPMHPSLNTPLMKELKEKYGCVLAASYSICSLLTKYSIECKEKIIG
jgi:saccharopine dehydrogenase (NADP+, L-glutamate forming)